MLPPISATPSSLNHHHFQCHDSSPAHKLLPAVDVISRSRKSGIAHDVYSKRRDVLRLDHAPNRKRRAKLIAAVLQLIPHDGAYNCVSTNLPAMRSPENPVKLPKPW